MMAREARDRFPTATDLVVALERSQLADQLPSFVDIELAMQDPEARARLISSNQPTSPDLRLSTQNGVAKHANVNEEPAGPRDNAISAAGESWDLRFRDPQGQSFTRRATTNQVLHGLREGYWPAGVEAARGGESGGASRRRFRPIEAYPEFRQFAPVADAVEPAVRQPQADLPERLLGVRQWKIMLSAAFGIGILAAASVAALYRLFLLQ
jgi:hypothetical protein